MLVKNSVLFMILTIVIVIAQNSENNNTVKEQGYRIEQPGTITFTVGVKIRGKVEKPQVVIFLLKEKTHHKEMEFSYSFKKDMSKPLPFIPIIE